MIFCERVIIPNSSSVTFTHTHTNTALLLLHANFSPYVLVDFDLSIFVGQFEFCCHNQWKHHNNVYTLKNCLLNEMVNKREKESDRETSDSKKHRKANFSNSTEVPAKIAKVDIYAVRIDCNCKFVDITSMS